MMYRAVDLGNQLVYTLSEREVPSIGVSKNRRSVTLALRDGTFSAREFAGRRARSKGLAGSGAGNEAGVGDGTSVGMGVGVSTGAGVSAIGAVVGSGTGSFEVGVRLGVGSGVGTIVALGPDVTAVVGGSVGAGGIPVVAAWVGTGAGEDSAVTEEAGIAVGPASGVADEVLWEQPTVTSNNSRVAKAIIRSIFHSFYSIGAIKAGLLKQRINAQHK